MGVQRKVRSRQRKLIFNCLSFGHRPKFTIERNKIQHVEPVCISSLGKPVNVFKIHYHPFLIFENFQNVERIYKLYTYILIPYISIIFYIYIY